jgi:hypothetical protein
MESHTSRHTLLLFICITADAFARATMPVIMQSPQVRTAMPATASVRSLPTLKQPVVQVPVAVNPEAGTKTTAGAAAPADSTTMTTTTPVTAKVPNLRSVEQLRREMADSEASPAETPAAVKPEVHGADGVPKKVEKLKQEAPVVVGSMLSPNGDSTQPDSAAPPAAAADMKKRQRDVEAPKVEEAKTAAAEAPVAKAPAATTEAEAPVAETPATTEAEAPAETKDTTAAAAAVAANQAAVAAEAPAVTGAAAGAN